MILHLFHDWTKWEEREGVRTPRFGRFAGIEIPTTIQVRRCTKCGLKELRR